MNITPTQRSITEFHLALSEADARELLESPAAFGERLAQMVRDASAPATGGGPSTVTRRAHGHKPGRQPRVSGRKAARTPVRSRGPAVSAKNGHRPRQTAKGGSYEKIQCQYCPRRVSRARMNRHVLTNHRGSTPSTDSSASPAVAHAAG
jgi:hypothetical protein